MVELSIPDELYAAVQRVAAEAGVTEDAVVQEAVAAHLERLLLPEEPLTADQLDHLRRGYEELKLGKGLEGEPMLAQLEGWLKVTAER